MDTGSKVTLIPKYFWECIGKLTLRKSTSPLRQFDRLIIKALGHFEGSLGLKDKFEVNPIIVTTCKINHGHLASTSFARSP